MFVLSQSGKSNYKYCDIEKICMIKDVFKNAEKKGVMIALDRTKKSYETLGYYESDARCEEVFDELINAMVRNEPHRMPKK